MGNNHRNRKATVECGRCGGTGAVVIWAVGMIEPVDGDVCACDEADLRIVNSTDE